MATLEELEKKAAEEEKSYKEKQDAFEKDPINKELKQKLAEIIPKINELQNKKEKIRKKIASKYLTDEAYRSDYHSSRNGFVREGNVHPLLIQAIKDVVGPISKLKKTDVEYIVDQIIEGEESLATADIDVERVKLDREEAEIFKRMQSLQEAVLGPQLGKLQEAKRAVNEFQNAQSPRTELDKFRENATSVETRVKIKECYRKLGTQERKKAEECK